MAQRNWSKYVTSSLLAATVFGSGMIATVKHNEGYSPRAYLDGAGIYTVCYGETKGVTKNTVKTKSECDAQLQQSLIAHSKALDGLPDTTTDVTALGALDLAYNIGVSGFSNSLAKNAIMKNDLDAAYNAVLEWRFITIKRNGKKVKFDCSTKGNKICWGLWVRRQWQAKAVGNRFATVQEAIRELPR